MKKILTALAALAFASCGHIEDGLPERPTSVTMDDLAGNWVESNGLISLWIRAQSASYGDYWYIDVAGMHQGAIQLLGGSEVTFYLTPFSDFIPVLILDAEWRFDGSRDEYVLTLTDGDKLFLIER